MNSVVLYTPGHNLITDSLIMHGIVRYLLWADANMDSVKIRRLGDRFIIEVGDPDSIKKDKAEYVLRSTQYQANIGILSRVDYTYLTRFFEKINAANPNRPVREFRKWIQQFSQAITKFDFDSVRAYEDYNHIENEGEGRVGTGYPTLYLPLGPVYGKYDQSNYSMQATQYKVCYTCFLFANLGLVYGTGIIRLEKGNRAKSIMFTLIPTNETEMVDVVLTQRAFEFVHERFMGIDIPTIAVPLIALSIGETLYAFKDVDVLVWVYEKSGNSLRITQPIHVNVSRLLRTLSTIKYYVPEWPRVVHECFLSNDDGPVILATLTETIINNNVNAEIYGLTRLITTFMNTNNKCERFRESIGKLIMGLSQSIQ
jgi:CRISPR-associated protein Csa4